MEITEPLDLTLPEESLIDMHSILNTMNVVSYEIMRIQDLAPDGDELEELMDANAEAAEALRDPSQASNLIQTLDQFINHLRARLFSWAEKHGVVHSPEFNQSIKNLDSIFSVMDLRVTEIVARSRNPNAWIRYEISVLKRCFDQFFSAMEQNSHGRYRIVQNLARQSKEDYFVHLAIEGEDGRHILMPAVFQDVIRDLIANARKYSEQGGRVLAGVFQDETTLTAVVEDNGIGMLPHEIPNLIGFGNRGSNLQGKATMGGGFGLTKAYFVTRKFGGRMWIDSNGIKGEGSRIRIVLPLPEFARNSAISAS